MISDVERSPQSSAVLAYGVITAAFFTVSIAYAVRYGYGMLLPGMLNDLQITKTEAGVISATYFAAYTMSSPVVGLLSDRSSPRLIITFFSVLLALGTLLMGFVNSVFQASVVFGLVGIGHAACWAPVVSLVQQWVSDRYRERPWPSPQPEAESALQRGVCGCRKLSKARVIEPAGYRWGYSASLSPHSILC